MGSRRLTPWRTLTPRERARTAFALRGDALGWFGIGVDYPTNGLNIYVTDPTEGVIAELNDRIGAEFVRVVAGEPPSW